MSQHVDFIEISRSFYGFSIINLGGVRQKVRMGSTEQSNILILLEYQRKAGFGFEINLGEGGQSSAGGRKVTVRLPVTVPTVHAISAVAGVGVWSWTQSRPE